ncbi:MAG: ABC transporter ATP-binding protein [Chloroflexota bacterium]|nr:ABC transporter ATP-binding protein [Chloroflexota bacterium]
MRASRGAAIEVDDLRTSYDGRAVLRGISFDVQPGEIVALLGPNGAGKTTTVEIIEGYRRPDGGSVRVLGTDPARGGRQHRARVGLMLQGGGGIDPRMTAREVVGLHARFHADPLDADELLGRVGLAGTTARTRYRRLSGGERQRVGLALALVGRPEVAILDEPTAGMDVEARATTRELLTGLREQGVAVVLTSHDLADVERVADRIAILDRGRIVALGRADALRDAGLPVLRVRLAATLSEADLAHLVATLDRGAAAGAEPSAVLADGGTGRYRVTGAAVSPDAIARLADWCSARGALIVELRTGGGTLEERYLELTGSANPDDAADLDR